MTISNWRFLSDPYFIGNKYVVLPLTGTLISISSSRAIIQKLGFLVRLLGLHANSVRDDQFFTSGSIIDLPPSENSSTDNDRRSRFISIFVRYSLMFLPLGLVVRIINTITQMCTDSPNRLTRRKLELVSTAFGRRSRDDCLHIAICRYALLRLHGINSSICIGVLVPTDEMHAWVEIDGHPILECSDVLVHYQACLKLSGY